MFRERPSEKVWGVLAKAPLLHRLAVQSCGALEFGILARQHDPLWGRHSTHPRVMAALEAVCAERGIDINGPENFATLGRVFGAVEDVEDPAYTVSDRDIAEAVERALDDWEVGDDL